MEPRILETQNDKGGTYKGFRLLIHQYSFSATISLVGSGSITFVPSADLDILRSTADGNNLLRRPTNFCHRSSHPSSFVFITSFFHMDSFGLPSSKHRSCPFGWMDMFWVSLVFWWSCCNSKFCVIDNSVCSRHSGLYSLHFRGFRRFGMKSSSTILCWL